MSNVHFSWKRLLRHSFWTAGAIGLLAGSARGGATPSLDEGQIAKTRYGADAPWFLHRIPYFASSDDKLDAVYYYRWNLYRAHQRDLGEKGFISTEFLDDVGWQQEPFASLNDASGFHIGEGRWLRDPRYVNDYLRFMYSGGNDRHFTDYMADSAWGNYLVSGEASRVVEFLPAMQALFSQWDDHLDPAKELYWTEPLLDATEYTVSSINESGGIDGFFGGNAFRPSINSYMYANARAISHVIKLAGKQDAEFYDTAARRIRERTEQGLWNDRMVHYLDRHSTQNDKVSYWAPIDARELVGYLPWTFDLAPDDPRHAAAWSHILSPEQLGGTYGLRTVEPTYQYYMHQYRYDGGGWTGGRPECQWNGPAWPFQTTQVLIGLANLLDHYRYSPATRSDYMRLLRQYTNLHFQGKRLDLEEDYDPDTGRPIVGLARSHHYFHSGFVDLVMTGLVGIRPREDDVLEVNPALPAAGDAQGLRWFRAQSVPYHGHLVSVTWDEDGSHFGRKGLEIEIDGKIAARRDTIGRITVPVTRRAPPAVASPTARSIQLDRNDYPKGSASEADEPENLHDAIDGRVWFFPELSNGWSSDLGQKEQWYAIDFGKPVRVERAEIAFFADGGRFAAPNAIRLQFWQNGVWIDLRGTQDIPVANGVTNSRWSPVTTNRIRIVMARNENRATRLVEFKVF